jgi:hypothetical protein
MVYLVWLSSQQLIQRTRLNQAMADLVRSDKIETYRVVYIKIWNEECHPVVLSSYRGGFFNKHLTYHNRIFMGMTFKSTKVGSRTSVR